MGEFIGIVIACLLISAALAVLDSKIGGPAYRWCRPIFPWSAQLSTDSNAGFLVQQNWRHRTFMAIGLFVLWLVLCLVFSGVVTRDGILWGLVVVPVLVIGSYGGDLLGYLLNRGAEIADAVEANPRGAAETVKGAVKEAFTPRQATPAAAPEETPPAAAEPPAVLITPAPAPLTAEEKLKEFTGG